MQAITIPTEATLSMQTINQINEYLDPMAGSLAWQEIDPATIVYWIYLPRGMIYSQIKQVVEHVKALVK